MIRRRNAILLAVGLLAPLALVDAPAGAIDQDLVVSTVSGPPGTAVTVSSASCTPASEGDTSLSVSLYTGTAPNEQIAAFSEGFDGTATITVPDWVDPNEPAVLEAECLDYRDSFEELAYDPVAFDVEPGVGAPVQVRTFSRTELLAGQGLTVTGSCGSELGDGFVRGIVAPGTDQTGRDIDVAVGQGFAPAEADGSFELELYVTNAFVNLNIAVGGDDDVEGVEVDESPLDVPPGDYTAFVYCSAMGSDSESSLLFVEPQAIEVTGAAPTGGIDLTAATNSAEVTLAGECTEGDVLGGLEGIPMSDIVGDFEDPIELARTNRFATARTDVPSGSATSRLAAAADLVRTEGGTGRALAGDGYAEFEGTPAADGVWSFTDTAGFDDGIVIGLATCGDPLADGYVYDPQGVAIEVVEDTTTTTTTTTTTPVSPPANAVAGTPTYAG